MSFSSSSHMPLLSSCSITFLFSWSTPSLPPSASYEQLTLPILLYLSHSNSSSLIHLLIALMFFCGIIIEYVRIYMMYLHIQVLSSGSYIFLQCSGSDRLASALLPLQLCQLLCFCCCKHMAFVSIRKSIHRYSTDHFSHSVISKASWVAFTSAN